MKNDLRAMAAANAGHGNEWAKFLLLAVVGLPFTMVALIAGYGFIVWFLQMLFLGPPS